MKILKLIYFSLVIILIASIIVLYLVELKNNNHLPENKNFKKSIYAENPQESTPKENRETMLINQSSIIYPEVTYYNDFLGLNFISNGGGSLGENESHENNQTQQHSQNTSSENNNNCISNEDLIIPPENFKVAFIGDSGYGDNFRQVLELIRNENVDLVLHQGDLGYDEGNSESPQRWIDVVNSVLGENFPYIYSIGNHDVRQWETPNGYRSILEQRLRNLNISYTGIQEELGAKTSLEYNGIFINLLGPGINANFSSENHDRFIDEQMSQSNSLWKICSWHKNMRAMQAGGKGDETGWGVYEKCREQGAIIATAHEHSYSRTHILSDMSEQIITDNTNPWTIFPGQTFAFVSGLGGSSIREQRIFADYFASIYTSTQNANYGALFIEFNIDNNPRKARGYFKNINGEIADQFEIENNLNTQCETETQSNNFVTREGSVLKLGNESFKFIGVNVYGLANDDSIYSCGGSANDGEMSNRYLDHLFSYLNENGIDTIRFWAFQSFTNGGTDFFSIDRIISYSRAYNIKLIPTLENHWDDCTNNEKNSEWYREGYLHPYGSYPISYKEYVNLIVTRYQNESSILMWQLMNEAESENAESLYNFALNMSQFIKSIDNNHLVSLGTLGTGQAGTANENYFNLHSIAAIDIAEAHDYHNEEESLSSGRNNIESDLQIAEELNKPFFIGEAGINAGCNNCYTLNERASLFNAKINASFNAGTDGYLIWRYDNLPGNFGGSCGNGYCFTENDPLFEVMQRY